MTPTALAGGILYYHHHHRGNLVKCYFKKAAVFSVGPHRSQMEEEEEEAWLNRWGINSSVTLFALSLARSLGLPLTFWLFFSLRLIWARCRVGSSSFIREFSAAIQSDPFFCQIPWWPQYKFTTRVKSLQLKDRRLCYMNTFDLYSGPQYSITGLARPHFRMGNMFWVKNTEFKVICPFRFVFCYIRIDHIQDVSLRKNDYLHQIILIFEFAHKNILTYY